MLRRGKKEALLLFVTLAIAVVTASTDIDDIVPELAQDLGIPAAAAKTKQIVANDHVESKASSQEDKRIEADAQRAATMQGAALLKPKKDTKTIPAKVAKVGDIDYSMTEGKAMNALTQNTEDMLRRDLTLRPITWPTKEEVAAALKAKQQRAKVTRDVLKVATSKALMKEERDKMNAAKAALGHLKEGSTAADEGSSAADVAKSTGALKATKKELREAVLQHAPPSVIKKLAHHAVQESRSIRTLKRSIRTLPPPEDKDTCEDSCASKFSGQHDSCIRQCLPTDSSCIKSCNHHTEECACGCTQGKRWECDGDHCRCWALEGDLNNGPVEEAMMNAENKALAEGHTPQEAKEAAREAEVAAQAAHKSETMEMLQMQQWMNGQQ